MTEEARRKRLVRRLLAAPDAKAARAIARENRDACDADLVGAMIVALRALLASSPAKAGVALHGLRAAATACGDPRAHARAAAAEGAIAHVQGRPAAARRALLRAAELNRSVGQRAEEADAWRGLMEVERESGRPAAARAAFRKAERVLKGMGKPQPARRGRLLMNLGNVHFQIDRHHDALGAYAEARKLLVRAEDPATVASCDYNRANILSTLDRLDDARALYEAARAAFEERSLGAAVAQCDYALAGLDVLEGRLDQGLNALEAVADRRRALGDVIGAAHAQLDAADALLRLNRVSEATQTLRAARPVLHRAGHAGGVALADMLLGAAALQAGRPHAARRAFRSALRLRHAEGNKVAAATARLGLAAAELRAGHADVALSLSRAAASRLERAALPCRAARALVVASEALLALGRPRRARSAAGRAASLARRREPRVEMAALVAEARAEEVLGRRDEARELLLRAADLVEQMRLGVSSEESQLAFGLDKSEVFEALVLNRLAEGTPAAVREALLHAERGKARALAERLSRGASRGDLAVPAARATLRRLRDLERRLAAAEARIEAPEGRPGLRSRRETEALRLIDERSRLLARVRREDPREALALGAPQVDPWNGVRALGREELALEYVEAGGEYHLFAVQSGKIVAHPGIASVSEIAELLDRLRFQLGKGVLGEDHAEMHRATLESALSGRLARLFDLLLGPVADRLEGRNVRIIPHGTLHGLPFHALRRDDRALAQICVVSHAPSLAVLGLLARADERPHSAPLVLGVPDAAAPEIEAEVAAISRHAGHARIFRGATATTEALKMAADRPNVLHVACHGVFMDGGSQPGALRLGDAWLSAGELQSMRAAGDLVVLSGCETGRGRVHSGDEWVGLVRAFLLAGARCVVASLWEVHDRSTANLMDDFYGHVRSGRSVGEALALAQRAAIAAGVPLLQWAPFVAVGDPTLRLDLRRVA